jgi:hypothetical protein
MEQGAAFFLKPEQRVALFNTGLGNKYTDAIDERLKQKRVL